MSARDEFFLALGAHGANQRQAQNAFYALDYAIRLHREGVASYVTENHFQTVDKLLSPFGLKLSEHTPDAKAVKK